MKQYTTPEQTAKLIELGFEEPKNRLVKQRFDRSTSSWIVVGEEGNYSIGELIEMLPDDGVADRRLEFDGFHWFVDWDSFDKIHQTMGVELVDALYDMIIKLKEEGVLNTPESLG